MLCNQFEFGLIPNRILNSIHDPKDLFFIMRMSHLINSTDRSHNKPLPITKYLVEQNILAKEKLNQINKVYVIII